MPALLLSRRLAPPLAYITGSLGTLIGADLMNQGRVAGPGAPIAFHRRGWNLRRDFPGGDTGGVAGEPADWGAPGSLIE